MIHQLPVNAEFELNGQQGGYNFFLGYINEAQMPVLAEAFRAFCTALEAGRVPYRIRASSGCWTLIGSERHRYPDGPPAPPKPEQNIINIFHAAPIGEPEEKKPDEKKPDKPKPTPISTWRL